MRAIRDRAALRIQPGAPHFFAAAGSATTDEPIGSGRACVAPFRAASQDALPVEALTGRFTEHHAFLLHRVDAITADIATVQARIDARIGELAPAVARCLGPAGRGAVSGAARQMRAARTSAESHPPWHQSTGRCPSPPTLPTRLGLPSSRAGQRAVQPSPDGRASGSASSTCCTRGGTSRAWAAVTATVPDGVAARSAVRPQGC
jgi:hypothetical protein